MKLRPAAATSRCSLSRSEPVPRSCSLTAGGSTPATAAHGFIRAKPSVARPFWLRLSTSLSIPGAAPQPTARDTM